MANKFVDFRVKYEESDNPLIRGARIVTEKVQVSSAQKDLHNLQYCCLQV